MYFAGYLTFTWLYCLQNITIFQRFQSLPMHYTKLLHYTTCTTLYYMYYTILHLLHYATCTMLYWMYYPILHVLICTTCTSLYYMYITILHVLHYTSCTTLYYMYFNILHVLHFTTCTSLYCCNQHYYKLPPSLTTDLQMYRCTDVGRSIVAAIFVSWRILYISHTDLHICMMSQTDL